MGDRIGTILEFTKLVIDFFIPSILFLYITGWIGWVGRAYLIAVRDSKDAQIKEKMGFAPSSATTCSPTSAVATARVEKTIWDVERYPGGLCAQ